MKKPSSKGLKNLKSWVFQKFTFDFIEKTARETGFMQRKRKLDPVLLIFTLIFGVSSHMKPTLDEIHRHYIDLDDNPKILTSIRNQSFRKRFNLKLVDFLKSLMEHYIDQMVHQSPAHLKGIVEDFKDILVTDYKKHLSERNKNNTLEYHKLIYSSKQGIFDLIFEQ